jgi:protein-tyrosine-phosphatase
MRTTDLLADLRGRFEGSFDDVSLHQELTRTLSMFGHQGGPVVDPLVAGYLQDRLRAIAAGRGLLATTDPTVLFVCVHNAGRSQMAASLLRARAPRITVLSAGSKPGPAVNPVVVRAMAELGLDLSQAQPARLTTDTVRRADLAITMGCGDACPVLPGTAYLDWAIPDPSGQPLEVVRRIRDEISDRVDTLVAALRSA